MAAQTNADLTAMKRESNKKKRNSLLFCFSVLLLHLGQERGIFNCLRNSKKVF